MMSNKEPNVQPALSLPDPFCPKACLLERAFLNCSVVSQTKDRARKAADNRTRIAANYLYNSELQVQMYTGADWYITFGLTPMLLHQLLTLMILY